MTEAPASRARRASSRSAVTTMTSLGWRKRAISRTMTSSAGSEPDSRIERLPSDEVRSPAPSKKTIALAFVARRRSAISARKAFRSSSEGRPVPLARPMRLLPSRKYGTSDLLAPARVRDAEEEDRQGVAHPGGVGDQQEKQPRKHDRREPRLEEQERGQDDRHDVLGERERELREAARRRRRGDPAGGPGGMGTERDNGRAEPDPEAGRKRRVGDAGKREERPDEGPQDGLKGFPDPVHEGDLGYDELRQEEHERELKGERARQQRRRDPGKLLRQEPDEPVEEKQNRPGIQAGGGREAEAGQESGHARCRNSRARSPGLFFSSSTGSSMFGDFGIATPSGFSKVSMTSFSLSPVTSLRSWVLSFEGSRCTARRANRIASSLRPWRCRARAASRRYCCFLGSRRAASIRFSRPRSTQLAF